MTKKISRKLFFRDFGEKICAKVFTKKISRKKKQNYSAKIFAQKIFRQNLVFSWNFVNFFTKGFLKSICLVSRKGIIIAIFYENF